MARDKLDSHGSSKKASSTPLSEKKSHKRKRDQDGAAAVSSTPTPSKKSKKTESPSSTPTTLKDKPKKKRKPAVSPDSSDQEESTSKESPVPSRSGKTASSSKDDGNAKTTKKSKKIKRKSAGNDVDQSEEDANLVEMKDADDDEVETQKQSEDVESPSKPAKNKFSGILSKFERSAKVKKAKKTTEHDKDEAEDAGVMTAEPVIAQGLEPLPQPEVAPEETEKPTYSSLPPWLANPLRASADERTKFSDLGIESNLLRILEDNGYKDAFAVQSTVIPLLLPGPKKHSGDLCISAATGSGKTLSYVLPLVTDLKPMPAPRLRGVIVVPTRELVKQAREACELCAAGSGLRVASAVGNVAIKDEQRSLMRIDQAYGPETFKQRQSFKLVDEDWTNFSLQDFITEADDESESLPGYVHKTEPNVDILICTPGRLVDHLRYTKGFTLKHLEWLVIDEADRLLNESFQEWVDVVMNSLDARKAADSFGFSGTFLSELGLPIQSKEPRKIVLSATMTRDISKLNTLRLSNPQLVIVGSEQGPTGENGDEQDRSDEQFTLPPTLKEFSIPVGDGAKKPLHLLSLLRSHVKVEASNKPKSALSDDTSDSGTSSSEDSDSDDTSSDGSSSDDSDSDDTSSDESSSDDSDSDSEDDTSSSGSDSDSDASDSSSESEDEAVEKKKRGPARTTVLVFTKSSESASRLSRLLALLDPSLATTIGTIIKSNKSSASRKTLTAYRQGKISIIIATDRASRGLDLPSLSHVVNYDVPSSVTTYVHRVGRTARAGKEGSAWTLVAHREGRWFEKEIAKGSDGKITRLVKVDRVNVKLDGMEDAKSRYGRALEALESEVKAGAVVKSAKTEA
ncbi:putative ATP-dependent RNA helicase DBP6 [Aspergillus melleus]|uniref:putative ATP-dependent RNA helicase DBP6 n=1 Tax=Aspergillus melleus TaxID=138277 RepID=UPI001E8EA4A6|nr:ATP-dependent RNA helicase dbp6 [Aspergillus melleus]KAH8433482.1 ATP-dependent RNA helicase dbp6 [Aspergillus melleus]